ncbi:hypothetical protein BJ165DRAFT_1532638 [Panaeolus papilionaceus]|nr:hypothetical protein BJ165DRAFT_1532638 [Panaeolus papilionaceus]
MATTSKMEYKTIKVTGPVSVEQVDRVQGRYCSVLIMGLTGAGKSSLCICHLVAHTKDITHDFNTLDFRSSCLVYQGPWPQGLLEDIQ